MMSARLSVASLCVAALACASVASAQTSMSSPSRDWTGPYIGATVGAALQRDDTSEVVEFDTNLDGMFGDTVRTAAGANAFSPGFCAGIAMGVQPAAGCTEDEDGIDVGGRVGYDRQIGALVVGGRLDVARLDVTDGVSAFSTTPAFYAFARELKFAAGLHGRVGLGSDRVLAYGTGGPAWARMDHTFTSSNAVNTFVPGTDTTVTDGSWGYQVGGGLEMRLGGRWTVIGEYLYSSFDDSDDGLVRSQGPAPATNPFILTNAAGTDLRRTDRFTMHSLRVGLTYR